MTTITIPARIARRGVRVQAARHDVAEALAADQPGDDDHRESEQDRLIDAEEQRPSCERQLHLLQDLVASSSPVACAASTVFPETPRMPRAVIRIAGDGVDHRSDHGQHRDQLKEDDDGHRVRERRDDLHGVENRRDRALEAVRPSPAAMPSGIPTRRESETAAIIERERLDALEQEAGWEQTSQMRRSPQMVAFYTSEADHDENTDDGSADSGHPGAEPDQPRDEVVQGRREAVEGSDDRARVVRVRWSTSHVWKSLRCVGSAVQTSPPGHEYSPLRPK